MTSQKQSIELPYQSDSTGLFSKLADLPWAVFLDSSHPHGNKGRYDILTAYPFITLTTYGETTQIITAGDVKNSGDNPFSLLKEILVAYPTPHDPTLPFVGGAIGYFGYDLARRLEHLPNLSEDDLALPDMAVGIYDWAIIVDHQEKRTWLATAGHANTTDSICETILARLQGPVSASLLRPVSLCSEFRSNLSKTAYAEAFARIQTYLYNGACYQVNLAQRFCAEVSGSPWQLYATLRQHNPAAFAAFLNMPAATILSLSPERFLKVAARQVETKPIKGTVPRGKNPAQDKQFIDLLCNSEKERAENLMIVDLLRNDLSKNCRPGSVKVPELFALESLPAVHHLVSTIKGELAADKHCVDLLRDCFPGGSVTGAPKVRAMQIIEELEPHRRNVYCGAIGYVDFAGNMDTNIAIRTLLWKNDQLYCSAGGALTADSELAAEYAETFAKVAVIFSVLNNL